MVEVGCWAHARRHVHQALDLDPVRMGAVLAYIAQLYAVEKRARQCGIFGEPLRLLREQAARPVIGQLHEYLLKIRDELLPKSEGGQAVAVIPGRAAQGQCLLVNSSDAAQFFGRHRACPPVSLA